MQPVRPAIKAGLIGCFWLVFLTAYFLRVPIPQAWTHLADLFWATLATLAAGGIGYLLVGRWVEESGRSLETFVFSTAAGLGLLSLVMVFLGAIGAWNSLVARSLVGFTSLSGLYVARTLFLKARNHRLTTPSVPVFRWPIILLTASGVLGFVLALAPVTYYDSLVYHMALPSAYVKAGRWVAETSLIYSSFPQNVEMLSTLGLLLRSETVANLLQWVLASLCVLATVSFGRRFLDESVGLLAGGLLAAMPAFLLLSTGGYVDVGLTLFCFLSLYALFAWREKPTLSMLILAGYFAGLAMGVKYTGGLPALIGGLFILWENRRKAYSSMARDFAIYSGVAFIVFLPWAIKNYLLVGNPVFPFFYSLGSQKLSPWVQNAAGGYFEGLTEYQPRGFLALGRLVWDAAVRGLDFGGGMDVLGDFGWALLIGLMPCLWLCRRVTSVTRLLLGYALLFFIPWGMSRPVLRFLMPLAPIFSLLAAEGWAQGVAIQPPEIRWLCRGVLSALLASGFVIFFYVTNVLSVFTVPLGLEDRSTFLRHRLTYYGAADFINQNTTPEASIFVLGDQRGYYYQRRVEISPVFNENPLVSWANAAATPAALVARVRQEGITHIVVNRSEMQRLANYNAFNFSEAGQKNWTALEERMSQKVYRDNHCEVLAL